MMQQTSDLDFFFSLKHSRGDDRVPWSSKPEVSARTSCRRLNGFQLTTPMLKDRDRVLLGKNTTHECQA